MLLKNPKVLIPFVFVAVVCLVRLTIYLYVGIMGLDNFVLENYAAIYINLVLYLFILFYAYKYFIKASFITLNPLIFKCGISNLATLIGLHNQNHTIFILTAVLLFLVPYVSDSVHAEKKAVALTAIMALILSIAISVLYIMHPAANYFAQFGDLIYNLDALNPTVEWILVSVLLLYKKLKYTPSTNDARA